MTSVRVFIETFDFKNPDWSEAPENFPNCELSGLSSSELGASMSIKTVWELSRPERPQQRSRVWQDPEGYRYLVQWSNAVLLRYLVRLATDALPRSEYRRKAQLDDAARSVVRNIEEGYKRATTREYLDFWGFSQGSLEEVKGDVREMTEDGFLVSRPGSSLVGIGVDLGEFNWALKDGKGDQRRKKENKDFLYRPLTILYPPLAKITVNDLSYEIFYELINKTDWLLRKLVESLEKKLADEQKWHQVEQARIREKFQNK
ncbi:MAG: four helix bundle protein [Patescibacteria group bacterium]